MGLINKLKGKRIFLDTAVLIYFIEGNSKYQSFLDELFDLNIKGKIEFITSSLTLLEVLVQPLKLNNGTLVEKYETILSESETIEIIDLSVPISKLAAKLRAKYNFKTPDSIQLGTAIDTSSDFFLTNDRKLKLDEIETLIIDEI